MGLYDANGIYTSGNNVTGKRSAGWGGKKSTISDLESGIADLLKGSVSPAPSTEQTTGTQSQQQTSQGVSTTGKNSLSQQQGTVNTNIANMSPAALAALDALISGKKKDPLLASKDQASAANISYLQSLQAGLDPAQAEQRASGRTAQLSRQLTEETLPALFGRSEAAGFGTSALSSLLAQDAAVRTAEAQSRAVEEAYFNTITAGINAASTLTDATEGTSAQTEALMDALGIAKGSISNSTETRDLTTTGREVGQTISSDTSSATSSSTGNTSDTNPLGWANTLGGMWQTLAAKPSEPTEREKALAAFMAAGGDLAALNSTNAWDGGYGASQRRLASQVGL